MKSQVTEHLSPAADDSPEDRAEARRRLIAWGAAPLHFFALLPDKRYLLSAPGQPEWAVAYLVVGRQALALGDPFGDPAAVPDAINGFQMLCRRHGWKPVWYQTTPAHLDTYRRNGFRVVKVGEDAQIVLPGWSLAGKKFVKLRNDLRRIEKAGVVLETYGPDALPGAACVAEMAAISAGWRRAHRAKEGGFAMGGFDPQSRLFAESRFFVARETETGRVLAFATFVPIFGAGEISGWTLDLMRRGSEARHGVMDFLIVSAAEMFAAEGAQVLSLGLSPLAGDDDPSEAAATSSVRRFLYTRLNRAYNFQGLHTFKSKFATDWEPRFLVYPGRLALAAASSAVLKAHTTTTAQSARPGPLRRWGRAHSLALIALLLFGLTPLEKTLARHAVSRPVRWARLPHFSPHLPFPHLTFRHAART